MNNEMVRDKIFQLTDKIMANSIINNNVSVIVVNQVIFEVNNAADEALKFDLKNTNNYNWKFPVLK